MKKPAPLSDIDTAPYWQAASECQLRCQQCSACRTYVFPPSPYCPQCRTPTTAWVEMSGLGTVYTYCVMHMALVTGFAPPYVVADVELDEQRGLRITANIVNCEPSEVRIGMPVRVTFEVRDDRVTLPQFEPVL